jgi:hypothetical protein
MPTAVFSRRAALPDKKRQVILIGAPGQEMRCGETVTNRQVAALGLSGQQPVLRSEL